jgi:hypothetical protein
MRLPIEERLRWVILRLQPVLNKDVEFGNSAALSRAEMADNRAFSHPLG